MEGKADQKILRKLGYQGQIFLSAERKTEELVKKIAKTAEIAVVLTDFDKHGKKQAKEITRKLDKEIDVIKTEREKFGKQLTSTDRRAIEDIKPLFENKNQKFVDATLDQLYFNP